MSWSAKQYFIEYESDKFDWLAYDREKGERGSYTHYYGSHASTIKTAKSYIRKIRRELAEENPRNFRIYDSWADVDPVTNYVPCVYQED